MKKDTILISESAMPRVVEITKSLVSLVDCVNPSWTKAFLRFSSRSHSTEVKVSFAHTEGVSMVNALSHKDFFHSFPQKGQDLLTDLGKSEGLFLIIVEKSLEFEIHFEYEDFNRWAISKAFGGTGIPVGLE